MTLLSSCKICPYCPHENLIAPYTIHRHISLKKVCQKAIMEKCWQNALIGNVAMLPYRMENMAILTFHQMWPYCLHVKCAYPVILGTHQVLLWTYSEFFLLTNSVKIRTRHFVILKKSWNIYESWRIWNFITELCTVYILLKIQLQLNFFKNKCKIFFYCNFLDLAHEHANCWCCTTSYNPET